MRSLTTTSSNIGIEGFVQFPLNVRKLQRNFFLTNEIDDGEFEEAFVKRNRRAKWEVGSGKWEANRQDMKARLLRNPEIRMKRNFRRKNTEIAIIHGDESNREKERGAGGGKCL